MKKIGLHTRNRTSARILIQFIAEIIMRETMTCLRDSKDCENMTWRSVSDHLKTIVKISFNSKRYDALATLSKCQRDITAALGIKDNK
jgi:hypothetical protein